MKLITEQDIKNIVEEAINVLFERHVIKVPHNDAPPMEGDNVPPPPPMDEPPMEDDPMGQEPLMDEPPMEDDGVSDNGGVNQEIIDAISKLSMEDQNAVLKYAKSMTDDSSNADGNMNAEPPMDNSDEQMPMEGRRISKKRINELFQDLTTYDNERIRDTKKITNKKMVKGNPFLSGRK